MDLDWKGLLPAFRRSAFWKAAWTVLWIAGALMAALLTAVSGLVGAIAWLQAKGTPLASSASSVVSLWSTISWQAWAMISLSTLVVCCAFVGGWGVVGVEDRAKKEIEAMRVTIEDTISARVRWIINNVEFTTGTVTVERQKTVSERIARLRDKVLLVGGAPLDYASAFAIVRNNLATGSNDSSIKYVLRCWATGIPAEDGPGDAAIDVSGIEDFVAECIVQGFAQPHPMHEWKTLQLTADGLLAAQELNTPPR